MAKKSEARETDIADAVDYVLTFEEMADIFAAAISGRRNCLKEEGARLPGRTDLRSHPAGVSEAVAETVRQLRMEDSGQVKGGTGDEWAGKGPAGNEPAGGWRACLP